LYYRGGGVATRYDQTICIPLDHAAELQEILSMTDYLEDAGRCEVLETLTADFGQGIEADIKICNGDGPYIDPVLFDHGCEIAIGEVGGVILDEFWFGVDDAEYVVHVKAEEAV
jgi:hypothetical protein